MTDPFKWVTRDYRLREKRDLEELQTDIKKATSANSYSWIIKGNITMKLAQGAERIIDVGCGWGRELIRLKNAIGIDIEMPFLRTARNYVKNDVILADAHYIPFTDNTFDFAVLSEVVEHLTDVRKVLKELKRILKPKAKLLIQTPNKNITLGKFIKKKDCGHVHEFTFIELKNILKKLGFEVLLRTGSTIPYIPSTSKLERLNSNKVFFTFWKTLNRIIPIKWDLIVLCELSDKKT
ncbi:MAG: methyltransferase domain-containing protein [Candidatus Jordarchaeaceae archaeon]